MPDGWSDRRDALPQGCVLRDYTVQEVLGHGGFGIVYKARHNELDQVVAIKEYLPSELAVREGATVRAKSADCETYFADGLRRFREEAQALIDFQRHPSTVACSEFFRANSTAYLVMEYVDGQPLSRVLREREAAGQPFTESDLLAIAVPLAEGLAHIHKAGVIHRDIKPGNILVRRADRQPVLIDFGAAKQAVAEHSRSLAPYTEGYAALEQVADGRLGPWTDLYGYGAVLWRMVAGGNRPWEPPNPVKVERRANAKVREAEDPLPAAKKLGAGRFAEGLLEMIDGCLQLRDSERLGDIQRVVELLQASGDRDRVPTSAEPQAEGSAVSVQPESVSEEAKPVSRSQAGLRMFLAIAAVLAAVLALATAAVMRPARWSFRIEPIPTTATVSLVDGSAPYRPGMPLVPGLYEVEVSAPGYITRREWIAHSEAQTSHTVKLYSIGEGMPRDFVSAAELYMRACEGGSAVGCHKLGMAYYSGDGVGQDKERAAELYMRACEGGDAVSCRNLGVLHRTGEGVGLDASLAVEFFSRACEGGDAVGCHALGILYRSGIAWRTPSRRWRRCCDNLGVLYGRGEGVGLNASRAAALFSRACEGGFAPGCTNLGTMYDEGEGVGVDKERATELYRRACDGGDAMGCFNLGRMYYRGVGIAQDRAIAIELFQKACKGDYTEHCEQLESLWK